MYSREQASQLRQAFWTTFGQYMAPVPSAEGGKVPWVNYKTGLKHVYFRLKADSQTASVNIELTHPDPDVQELCFEQFVEFKDVWHACVGEEWDWWLHTTDDNGQTISKISKEMEGVNLFKQDDWPALISFFKPRLIALDEFWSQARYGFEEFR